MLVFCEESATEGEREQKEVQKGNKYKWWAVDAELGGRGDSPGSRVDNEKLVE